MILTIILVAIVVVTITIVIGIRNHKENNVTEIQCDEKPQTKRETIYYPDWKFTNNPKNPYADLGNKPIHKPVYGTYGTYGTSSPRTSDYNENQNSKQHDYYKSNMPDHEVDDGYDTSDLNDLMGY